MDAAQQEAITLDAYYPVFLVEKLLFSHAGLDAGSHLNDATLIPAMQ
jgi:hypothetical protein